jgi:hypothetical protein
MTLSAIDDRAGQLTAVLTELKRQVERQIDAPRRCWTFTTQAWGVLVKS